MIDAEFEEVTEGEESAAQGEAQDQVGADGGDGRHRAARLELVAKDIVDHFETRQAGNPRRGKAMIVCMSRRICVDLYDEIVKLRPEWHGAGGTGRRRAARSRWS